MITIVDIGVGNISSIENMLKKIGCEVTVSNNREIILTSSKLILPGVGTFDYGMRSLRELNLEDVLKEVIVSRGIPILGICLGMQMLGLDSEEGVEPGLGLINAHTYRFSVSAWNKKLKIPHMGWNNIYSKGSNILLEGIDKPRFYFVHSFHVVCSDINDVSGITEYGQDFNSMIQKDNIYGVQFHPEKSHSFGFRLLKNFVVSC